MLVFQHLVEVERVDPLGVEARKHLINDDEQVYLLLRMPLDAHVGLLVGEARRHVALEGRVLRDAVALRLAKRRRITLEHLDQAILLVDGTAVVVDVGVEERRHLELWVLVAEDAVVGDGLGDAAGGEHRVELARERAAPPVAGDVLHDLTHVLGIAVTVGTRVLRSGQVSSTPSHAPSAFRCPAMGRDITRR